MLWVLCPSPGKKSRDCGLIQHSFCKSWACVTSNDGEWKWRVSRPDLIKFAFVNGVPWGRRPLLPTHGCQPTDTDRIKVTFTGDGKRDTPRWIQGKLWGLVFYKYGGHSGSTVVIRLKVETMGTPSKMVGPNKVLKPPYLGLPP
jgi:hypothetical protein